MSAIAYLISTFPVLEETFILGEILELERQGLPVEVFSLRLPPPTAHQPEAQQIRQRTHYCRYLSEAAIWGAVWYFASGRPGALARSLWGILRDNRGDWRCFLRTLVMVPKAIAFARSMERLGVRHVHAHWATYPVAVAAFIARLLGVSYSVTAHAYDIYTDQRPAALARRLANARFVATCSRTNQRYLSGLLNGQGSLVHAVYHGVDTSRFCGKQVVVDRKPVTVLAGCGTLDPRKGLRYLVEACRILVDGGTEVACRIVGAGPELANLKKQVELRHLEEVVTFWPSVPQSKLAGYYRDADIFIQPSIVCSNGDKDVIPNCLLEAMASGLAVVATAVSSIPEVIEDGADGLLVPEKDSRAIADAVGRLIGDQAMRRRLGEAACKRVEADFDRRATTERLRGLFDQLRLGREPGAHIVKE